MVSLVIYSVKQVKTRMCHAVFVRLTLGASVVKIASQLLAHKRKYVRPVYRRNVGDKTTWEAEVTSQNLGYI